MEYYTCYVEMTQQTFRRGPWICTLYAFFLFSFERNSSLGTEIFHVYFQPNKEFDLLFLAGFFLHVEGFSLFPLNFGVVE